VEERVPRPQLWCFSYPTVLQIRKLIGIESPFHSIKSGTMLQPRDNVELKLFPFAVKQRSGCIA
jgi:hypothetical protein